MCFLCAGTVSPRLWWSHHHSLLILPLLSRQQPLKSSGKTLQAPKIDVYQSGFKSENKATLTTQTEVVSVGNWLHGSCCLVAKLCLTLCAPVDCSTPGFPALHYLLEFAQTHIHWVGDAIHLAHPLMPPSSPVLNLPQHWGLYQWVGSSHQVVKVLEPKVWDSRKYDTVSE